MEAPHHLRDGVKVLVCFPADMVVIYCIRAVGVSSYGYELPFN